MRHQCRAFLRRLHPEGIPWPGSMIYNAVSQTEVFRRHYAQIAEHAAGYCETGRVHDIGTGPGWLLMALRKERPELELVGVDISPAMVDTARRNVSRTAAGAAIEIEVASAESLPFPGASFDSVVSTGSLHHWKQPAAALEEVHRVLKPGGWALIYDLVRHPPADVVARVRREFGPVRMRLLWLHSFEEPFYSPRDMEALAEATPFRHEKTEFVGALCCLVLRKVP